MRVSRNTGIMLNFFLYFIVLAGELSSATYTPRVLYPPTYTSTKVNTSEQISPEQNCCQSTCCSDCDPYMPWVQPPFGGTALEIPDSITEADQTAFIGASYTGQMYVDMWDGSSFEQTYAFIFVAQYSDGMTVTVAVHAAFGSTGAAEFQATRYATIMGRVPFMFRQKILNLHLRPGTYAEGCNAWGGGGTVTLCTGVGEDLIAHGNGEELFVHEGCHISLDASIYSDPAWVCAQNMDLMFISNYARDNRKTEDAAESILPWYASRYSANRVPQETLNKIQEAIPYRLKYFDDRFLQQPSGCSERISVFTDDFVGGPYQALNFIFGDYTKQPGQHNDHVWYLKDDNPTIKLYAAQGGQFHICPADTPDNTRSGWAYDTGSITDCAEDTATTWSYWDQNLNQWIAAGSKLQIMGY